MDQEHWGDITKDPPSAPDEPKGLLGARVVPSRGVMGAVTS